MISRSSEMKVVILAGGKATRMGKLAKNIPKPLLPVKGKPILEHQLEMLEKQGFTEVILGIGHLGDKIKKHFGGKFRSIDIKYAHEKEPLGTGGAVRLAVQQHNITDTFVLLFGDIMMNVNIRKMINFHFSRKAKATIILHKTDHPWDSDLAEIDENGKVIAFHKKPNKEPYPSNIGKSSVYVLEPKIFSNTPQKFDLEKDLLSKTELYGYTTNEFLKDVGTPERLKDIEKKL
jgi:NDP-sugar pyrophosphorylase family protein